MLSLLILSLCSSVPPSQANSRLQVPLVARVLEAKLKFESYTAQEVISSKWTVYRHFSWSNSANYRDFPWGSSSVWADSNTYNNGYTYIGTFDTEPTQYESNSYYDIRKQDVTGSVTHQTSMQQIDWKSNTWKAAKPCYEKQGSRINQAISAVSKEQYEHLKRLGLSKIVWVFRQVETADTLKSPRYYAGFRSSDGALLIYSGVWIRGVGCETGSPKRLRETILTLGK